MNEKKSLLVKPADALVINGTAFAWFMFSQTMREFDKVRYAGLKASGDKELAWLKGIAAKGDVQKLNGALTGFHWVKDQIDYVPDPWVVCALHRDDCDGSAWLLSALMPGMIYCTMRVSGGKVKDYDKWHFFFRDARGFIWSNYRLDKQIDEIQWARKYDSGATHLVQIDPAFKVTNIKTL